MKTKINRLRTHLKDLDIKIKKQGFCTLNQYIELTRIKELIKETDINEI